MEIVMPSFPFDYESPGKEFDWLLSIFAGILMCRTVSVFLLNLVPYCMLLLLGVEFFMSVAVR